MITLYVDKGVAYVWNADDWYSLRSQHRICGSLLGSIASYPRQNDFLGLPMALMSEEAAILVEKAICELVTLPKICSQPTTEEKSKFKDLEERQRKEQTEALRKRRIDQLSQKIDVIVAGKKKKLLSKGVTDPDVDKTLLLQEEINKLPEISPAHVLVHIPTKHVMNTEKHTVNIDVLTPSVTSHEGTIKYLVFKDLWEKGHHVTSGLKFGSDYLVYPGDPVKFHASYMVRCIYNNKGPFYPSNLVAFGRLSVAVNKLAVLASCDSHGRIEYQTLQWHDNIV